MTWDRLYNQKAPRYLLETRCLDEWIRVFEINEHPDQTAALPFKKRFWIHCKNGFRTSVRRRKEGGGGGLGETGCWLWSTINGPELAYFYGLLGLLGLLDLLDYFHCMARN